MEKSLKDSCVTVTESRCPWPKPLLEIWEMLHCTCSAEPSNFLSAGKRASVRSPGAAFHSSEWTNYCFHKQSAALWKPPVLLYSPAGGKKRLILGCLLPTVDEIEASDGAVVLGEMGADGHMPAQLRGSESPARNEIFDHRNKKMCASHVEFNACNFSPALIPEMPNHNFQLQQNRAKPDFLALVVVSRLNHTLSCIESAWQDV